ncbi:MAG: hypothetical protein AAFN79_14170 [Pseudomonadota bacterium]
MKQTILSAAIVAATLASTKAADAATFDLTGALAESATFSFVQDGIGLTVSTGLYNDLTNVIRGPGGDDVVHRNANGLGVDRFDFPGFLFIPPSEGDPPELNGSLEGSEMLILTFDQVVVFNTLSFGEVDADDDFDLAIDGAFVAEDVSIQPLNNPFVFAPGTRGTSLGVGADTFLGAITGGGDDFRVAGVSVTAVPIPAGGALLLTGLAALGFAGMRRRAGGAAKA